MKPNSDSLIRNVTILGLKARKFLKEIDDDKNNLIKRKNNGNKQGILIMSADKLPPNPGIKVITVSAEQAMQARNAYLEKEKAFFDSWKQGVSLAGYQYFGDGTLEGFENAKNKNDLRPSSEKIKATFGMKGDSEVAFLVAMYCFYNDIRGAQLSTEAGVITLLGHIMAFDIERREVIADLIMNYVGW